MGGGASTTIAAPPPIAAPVQVHLTWAHYVDPAGKEGASCREYCCASLDAIPITSQKGAALAESSAHVLHHGSTARTRPAYSCPAASPGTPMKHASATKAREGGSFVPQKGGFFQQSLKKQDLAPSSPCVRKEALLEIRDLGSPPHKQFDVGTGEKSAKKAEQHRMQFSQEWRNGEYRSIREWSGKVPDYQNRSEKHLQEVAKRLSHEELERVDRGLRAGVLDSVRSFDKSGDGRMSPRTLSRAISSTLPALTQEDIADLLCDASVDGSGRIEYAAVLEKGLCVEAQAAVHVESRGPKNAVSRQSWMRSSEHVHSKSAWAQPLQRFAQEGEPLEAPHPSADPGRRWSGSQVHSDHSSVHRGCQRQSPVGQGIGWLTPSPSHTAPREGSGPSSPQSPWSDVGSGGGTRSLPLGAGKRSSSFTFSEKRTPSAAGSRTTVGAVTHKKVPAIRFPEMPAATRNVPLNSPASIGRLQLNADGDVCL
eukprot:CAMPEP_0178393294 /NCGR_PEP_ID=MMETSP0689_2-20121128/12112_1 /TAXON_ID=160604 /ORGANISM="Amphidinium massartii, Strain CS-259" /LENGTH=480 /DNA_ID=CAMNT_0020013879 /DNA_START=82 /DNA_END=1520 /DNA_ORIENTATION=-